MLKEKLCDEQYTKNETLFADSQIIAMHRIKIEKIQGILKNQKYKYAY